MGKVTTGKPKITDVQIKAWINNQVHFEFKAIDTNLFLTFPDRFTVPVFNALQLWANYLESCETGSTWNVTPIRKQA